MGVPVPAVPSWAHGVSIFRLGSGGLSSLHSAGHDSSLAEPHPMLMCSWSPRLTLSCPPRGWVTAGPPWFHPAGKGEARMGQETLPRMC
jgi:hypothetical protein